MALTFDPALLDAPEFKEDSVREIIISPLLHQLGYAPTGPKRVIRSKHLVHPFVHIGSTTRHITLIPDYTLQFHDKTILVLDAKSPKESVLNSAHIQQVYSYAIHPEVRSRHFALCNGRQLALFSIDEANPILVVPLTTLDTDWSTIQAYFIHLEASPPQVPIAFLNWYDGTPRDPVPFGGRNTELLSLHHWLAEGAEPYALLTAPIGRGKTALVTRFAAAVRAGQEWQVAFVPISVRFGTSRPSHFLRDLVRHLARLQNRPLPADGTVPHWETLWRECFGAGPPLGQRPLLIIIDGLDEAQEWTITPSFLPDLINTMPDVLTRMRVLVTARAPHNASYWRRQLGWEAKHLARGFTLDTLDGAGILSAVASLGYPLDSLDNTVRWASELLRLTHGEPLLVRCYATELLTRSTQGRPLLLSDLSQRPPGLDGYVEDWWRDQQLLWRSRGDKESPNLQALLDIFAVAQGPLTLGDLRALRPTDPPGPLHDSIDALRRFLAGDGSDKAPFVLGHPALGEFFRSRLCEPANQVHSHFVRWGLSVISSISHASGDAFRIPRYLHFALRYHLSYGLAPLSQWRSILETAWLQSSIEVTGSTDALTLDLEALWDAIEHFSSGDIGPGPPRHWPLMIHCALIRASLRDDTKAVTLELACMATTNGYWPLGYFLSYVRDHNLSSPSDVRTLGLSLLSLGSGAVAAALQADLIPTREELLLNTLASVLTDYAEGVCGAPGSEYAPAWLPSSFRADPDMVNSVFSAAEALTANGRYTLALVTLAPLVEYGFERALTVVGAIGDHATRAEALTALTEHVPAALPQAWLAATKIPEPSSRTFALARLAARVPNGWAAVVSASNEIDNPRARALSLEDAAPHVPGGWSLALEAALAIPDPSERAFQLCDIAPHVFNGVALALESAEALAYADDRATAFRLLAPALENGWDRAFTAAELAHAGRSQLGDMTSHDYISRIAPNVPNGWERAMRAAETIVDPSHRAHRLAELSEHIPAGATRALSAIADVPDPEDRAEILQLLTPQTPMGWTEAVLHAAEEITEHESRARLLAVAAPHLPDGWRLALEAAESIPDLCQRAAALIRVAPHVDQGIPRALDAALHCIPTDRNRAFTVASLLDSQSATASRIDHILQWAPDQNTRVALARLIAPHTPNGWTQAITEALALDYSYDRVSALLLLSADEPDSLRIAEAVAGTISDPFALMKSRLLLAPHTKNGWVKASEAIDQIDERKVPVEYFAAIAPHVPGGWERAWHAACKDRSFEAIVTIAPNIDDGWKKALAVAEERADRPRTLARDLAVLAPHAGEVWARMFDAVDQVPDARDRIAVLLPNAPFHGGVRDRLLEEVKNLPNGVGTELRLLVHLAVAPHVSNGWLRALQAIVLEPCDKYRDRGLVTLMAHLPQEHWPVALSIARQHLADEGAKADVLLAMSREFPDLLLEVRWVSCPSLLVRLGTITFSGRTRLFRRELSAVSTTSTMIYDLLVAAQTHLSHWRLSASDALQVIEAVEAVAIWRAERPLLPPYDLSNRS